MASARNADSYPIANFDSNRYTDADSCSNNAGCTGPLCHSDTNIFADRHTDAYPDTDGNGYGHTDTDTNTDADADGPTVWGSCLATSHHESTGQLLPRPA